MEVTRKGGLGGLGPKDRLTASKVRVKEVGYTVTIAIPHGGHFLDTPSTVPITEGGSDRC